MPNHAAAEPAATKSGGFEITGLAKIGGPLSKRIRLQDGKVISDGSSCVMSSGEAERVRLDGLDKFANLISRLRSHEAIALGRLNQTLPDQVEVVTKSRLDKLNGQAPPGTIARIGTHISYAPGQPALALIDIDAKGMPRSVDDLIKAAGGYWEAMVNVLPGLAGSARVTRRSTSTGIYHTKTGERFPGSSGAHIFVLVQDGGDVERFLRTFHDRCWLAGLGWYIVGAAGQLLERAICDRSVYAPERLVFEGPPEMVAPLAQDTSQRAPVVTQGEALDTRVVCPPLTILEQSKLKELKAKDAQRVAPASAKARSAFVSSHAEKIVQRTGMTPEQAKRIVEQQTSGLLLPDVVLDWDDSELKGATVADVLADPERFDGATLADPLEGTEYGMCKAKVMRRADGSPLIHSFAHGRTVYELRYDAAAVRAALAAVTDAETVALFTRLMLLADMDRAEAEELRNDVAKRSGIGKRTLDHQAKQAKAEQAKQRAQEDSQRHAAERCDLRPQIPAPPPLAPWLPQMQVLNDVLGSAAEPEPPMRDIEGGMIAVRVRAVSTLHALTAFGSNDGDTDKTRLPAPEQPLLTKLGEVELSELIERHIDYIDEQDRSVHLGMSFVRHFLSRDDRALPTVAAVATMPMVLADGTILSGAGLDRKRGIVFRVPGALQRLMPDQKDCTADAVGAAMQYLTDEWLCDVATDYAGKCVLIASVATILERLVLPQRPAFFITAGQRGGGKTTVLNMVSVAAMGKQAAAAGWSNNEEERRKALFSYLGEGMPFLVWDNLPRGATVSCPSIEKALTAETYSDRVLGVSEIRTVPAYTVMAWTGNNVTPRGDMASRALCVRLAVDRADPENRLFRHADPIDWTERNRGAILRAIYTILLGNPRLQDKNPSPAETRFKAWWHVVGSAIEHAAALHAERVDALVCDALEGCRAAKISFRKLILAGEADEEQSASLAMVLETLWKKWPKGFKAADAAFYAASADDQAIALKGALEAATGRPLPVVSSITIAWRLKSLVDAPVNVDGSTLALRYMPDPHGGSFAVRKL